MKLFIIGVLQTIFLYNVQSGVVKNIYGIRTEHIHKVNDNFHNIDLVNKDSVVNSVLVHKDAVNNANEHLDGFFETKEQSGSSEDRTTSWSRDTHLNDNGLRKKENVHFHFKEHNERPEYSSSDRFSKPTLEHDTDYGEKYNNKHDYSWDNTHQANSGNNAEATSISIIIALNEIQTERDTAAFHNFKNTNALVDDNSDVTNVQFPGSQSKVIVKEDTHNSTRIDKIVFPGKVNSVERTECPDGLVITANGKCLEQQIIHMGSRNSTDGERGSAKVSGCLPAMGYSFAAGTTDGPGAFDFTQGTTTSNPLWNAVRDFIAEPTKDDIDCHAPKPILLATGRAKFPYEWQPRIVSCTLARIGNLYLAAVPGEFTTMSGRRLRSVVARAAGASKVVLAGLSNIYSDYIATPEEYQAQRYEAASTIYGPHTLDIYLNKYKELTEAVVKGTEVEPGPPPPDFSEQLITLVPPVLWDAAPWGKEFGDCVRQPDKQYGWGDVVTAAFVSGHPRNSIRHGRWYAAVERMESEEDDAWTVVATDGDWETKYIWLRNSKIMGTSTAEIEWEIPQGTSPGTYRIHHYGNYKYILGGIYPYHGFSDSFEVT